MYSAALPRIFASQTTNNGVSLRWASGLSSTAGWPPKPRCDHSPFDFSLWYELKIRLVQSQAPANPSELRALSTRVYHWIFETMGTAWACRLKGCVALKKPFFSTRFMTDCIVPNDEHHRRTTNQQRTRQSGSIQPKTGAQQASDHCRLVKNHENGPWEALPKTSAADNQKHQIEKKRRAVQKHVLNVNHLSQRNQHIHKKHATNCSCLSCFFCMFSESCLVLTCDKSHFHKAAYLFDDPTPRFHLDFPLEAAFRGSPSST